MKRVFSIAKAVIGASIFVGMPNSGSAGYPVYQQTGPNIKAPAPTAGYPVYQQTGPNIKVPAPTAGVEKRAGFESVIVSKFNGLKYGNLYQLQNGQIWQQTEPWVWIWVWVNPKVLIYQDEGVIKMKVENIDHSVTVERIK